MSDIFDNVKLTEVKGFNSIEYSKNESSDHKTEINKNKSKIKSESVDSDEEIKRKSKEFEEKRKQNPQSEIKKQDPDKSTSMWSKNTISF